jgi:hypothetical protein
MNPSGQQQFMFQGSATNTRGYATGPAQQQQSQQFSSMPMNSMAMPMGPSATSTGLDSFGGNSGMGMLGGGMGGLTSGPGGVGALAPGILGNSNVSNLAALSGGGEPGAAPAIDDSKIVELIQDILSPAARESALLELSKRRESFEELAPIVWHSFGEPLAGTWKQKAK